MFCNKLKDEVNGIKSLESTFTKHNSGTFCFYPFPRSCVSIYFTQTDASDFETLRDISHCFGLMSARNFKPKNLHNGMLRWVSFTFVLLSMS